MRKKVLLSTLALAAILLFSCGGEEPKKEEIEMKEDTKEVKSEENFLDNKGIGPIKELILPPEIDAKMASNGKQTYNEKCKSCHKENEKYIGPAPAGILKRRSPEWVMNMILNPEEMVQKDPIAKALLREFVSPMANQNLTEDEARNILEYFRTLEENTK